MGLDNFESFGFPSKMVPENLVAQSNGRDVLAFSSTPLVIKQWRDGLPTRIQSIGDIIEDIKRRESQREQIRELLEAQGSDGQQVVPRAHSVIHQDEKGKLTFSELQRFFPNAFSLAQLGSRVLQLPGQSLFDLRNLLTTSLMSQRQGGVFLDLAGSNLERPTSFTRKLQQRCLIIFSSENVVIDQTGQVRLVDAAILGTLDHKTIKNRLSERLQILGLNTSIMLINSALGKQLQQPTPTPAQSETYN